MTVDGPDRGYSWVIVLCCAYIHFALFGLFRSWGVIYVAVIQEYNVTREEASWPFSLCAAVFQLIGPAVSIITHFVSQRTTCLLGSTIATIGVVGCYFADSITWIIVFYGVVHGLGFGIIVTLIPVFLNQYFVKHKASAMGIAFSGGSVSSFVVPVVMEWLLENYNLRGSFLLLGGLVMNTLVASALLKPASWLKKDKNVSPSLLENSDAKDSGVSTNDAVVELKEQTTTTSNFQKQDEFYDSVFKNDEKIEYTESVVADNAEVEHSNFEEDGTDKQNTVISNNDSVLFDGSVTKMEDVANPVNSDKRNKDYQVTNDYEVEEPLMNGPEEVQIKPKNCELENKKSRFKCIVHPSITNILKSPMFWLIAISMLVFFVALQSFFVVIVDYAKDKGIPESEGVYLMSIFSLTDIFGRSCFGWVTDRKYIRRQSMVIFNFIAISVIMQLYPIFNNFTALLIVAAFHGISAGSCITLFFVLQAEYFGVKKLTLVVGLTSFLNGALTLLRPAMIGVFRDTIGSYDWMFHSLGLVSVLFAFIWMAESRLTQRNVCANDISNEQV